MSFWNKSEYKLVHFAYVVAKVIFWLLMRLLSVLCSKIKVDNTL